MKSARGFDERFYFKFCVKKRRHTLCISSFLSANVGMKEPPKPADDLFRVSLSVYIAKLFAFSEQKLKTGESPKAAQSPHPLHLSAGTGAGELL